MKPIKGNISNIGDSVKGVNQLNTKIRRHEAILKGIEDVRLKFHRALKSKSPEAYIKRLKDVIQIPIIHNYKYTMYNTILPLISSRVDTFTITTDRDYICPMETFYEYEKGNDAISTNNTSIYYNKTYNVKPSYLKGSEELYDTAYRIVGFPQDDRSASVAIAMQFLRDFKRNNTVYSLSGCWFTQENIQNFDEIWDYDKSIFSREDNRRNDIVPTITCHIFQNKECLYVIQDSVSLGEIYDKNDESSLCGRLRLIDDELCFVITHKDVLKIALELVEDLDNGHQLKHLAKYAQNYAETLKISPEELYFNKPNREEAIEAIFNMIEKSLKLMFSIH